MICKEFVGQYKENIKKLTKVYHIWDEKGEAAVGSEEFARLNEELALPCQEIRTGILTYQQCRCPDFKAQMKSEFKRSALAAERIREIVEKIV